jgi:uncharacterized sulfatase
LSSAWIFPANVRWLLRPLLFVFIAYFIQRLLFIAVYWTNFSKLSATDWLEFTFLSLRFDSSTIFSINLLFFVLLLFPFPKGKYYFEFVKWFFIAGNWVFLAINMADIPYFAFNTRRTSFEVLVNLSSDIQTQAPQLLVNFWPYTLLSIALLFPLWKSFKKNPQKGNFKWYASLFAMIFWAGISVFLIRNSIKLKPLLPGDAFTLRQSEAGNGVLNTPFLLFKTNEAVALPNDKWLSDSELKSIVKPGKNGTDGPLNGYNLVIIILESFSTEYTGMEGNPISYSPFLDSLASAGLYFPHHTSSGRTSRDAPPSILSSVPSWMDESFMHSQYVSIKTEGLGNILRSKGYKTAFYHGGKNGTMSFDLSARLSGFDEYYGMNEYPNSGKDFDGFWGIFDGPFLQNMAAELSKKPEPFAATVFTVSSHQPYTIPDPLKGKFKTGPLPIHESIGYADFALKEFFKTASKQKWYDKTLFVLTGDHTQQNADPGYAALEGRYDVPLILYCPSKKLIADTSAFVNHIDIRPSVLDLFGLNTINKSVLGASVFSKRDDFPIVYQGPNFYLFHPSGTLSWNAISLENGWEWTSPNQEAEPKNLRKLMAAQVQYYRQGLLKNKLFTPNP